MEYEEDGEERTGSLRPGVSVILKHAVYGAKVLIKIVLLCRKLNDRADVNRHSKQATMLTYYILAIVILDRPINSEMSFVLITFFKPNSA